MNLPKVVSATEWQAAREALAAERRRLPMVQIEKEYVLEGPDGKARVPDLFDGRRQLLLYHSCSGPTRTGL